MNDSIAVLLENGGQTFIDASDERLVAPYRWRALRQRRGFVYAVARMPGDGLLSLHRLILRAPPGRWVDHVDGDGLNNRRCNLRLASGTENACNRRKRIGPNRFKGIFRSHATNGSRGGRPWTARIQVAGQVFELGAFHTDVEAARAYDEAARDLHGPFARLNFPVETTGPDDPRARQRRESGAFSAP